MQVTPKPIKLTGMIVTREKARELCEELGIERTETHDVMAAGGNSAVEGRCPSRGELRTWQRSGLGPHNGLWTLARQ